MFQSRFHRRAGNTLLGIVVAVLLADGLMQVISPPAMLKALQETGWDASAGPQLAVVTFTCALTLAFPRSSIFGAILTTAFLGGAIATHFRIGSIGSPPQLICIALGVAMWAGLHLRDRRVHNLLSVRGAPNRAGEQDGTTI